MRVEQLRIDGGADDATAFSVFETVADRLRASAAYIRDHWQQGLLCDQNGFVCAVGGLLGLREWSENVEMGLLALDPVADQAVTLVADYLVEHDAPFAEIAAQDGLRVSIVEQWNDDCARDGNEVAEVFEKVAALWEEKA